MFSTFVTCIFLLLAKSIFLRLLLDFTQDSQEPPPVDLWIPFISPIVRMSWTGFAYYTKHRRFPIYTIRLPGIRLYVVNSTSLISAVQYHPRTLSFAPILARTASNLIGASKSGVEVLSDNEANGFIKRFHDFNQANLSTGPSLDALTTKYWSLITSYHFQRSVNVPKNTRMYEWISHEVMMAASDAMYGTQNPFRDSTTRKFWKKYESGMILLLAGLMPSITSKQSLCAREALAKSLEQYYNRKGFENEEASPYIRDQYRIFSESGLSDQDIAKTSAAFSIALMGNTIPATFWLVYHIFSNETILHDCRKELLAVLQKSLNGGTSLDPLSVEQSCPIFSSTLKETLRTHSMGTSVTQVVEDQVIDNQYLLKKGALVLIPAVVQHSDKSAWGENVNDFDYLRFVRASSNKKKSWNPAADRVFGGGWTLCPGRLAATSFMLGFAASAIMSFDIQPSSGQWVTPTVKNSNLATAINQPDEDLDIQIHYREDDEWANSFTQLKPRV